MSGLGPFTIGSNGTFTNGGRHAPKSPGSAIVKGTFSADGTTVKGTVEVSAFKNSKRVSTARPSAAASSRSSPEVFPDQSSGANALSGMTVGHAASGRGSENMAYFGFARARE